MASDRRRNKLVAAMVAAAIITAPSADAAPPMCDSEIYRKTHTTICGPSEVPAESPGAFNLSPGGGGGGSGGLIGRIRDAIGGLTGGIL